MIDYLKTGVLTLVVITLSITGCKKSEALAEDSEKNPLAGTWSLIATLDHTEVEQAPTTSASSGSDFEWELDAKLSAGQKVDGKWTGSVEFTDKTYGMDLFGEYEFYTTDMDETYLIITVHNRNNPDWQGEIFCQTVGKLEDLSHIWNLGSLKVHKVDGSWIHTSYWFLTGKLVSG